MASLSALPALSGTRVAGVDHRLAHLGKDRFGTREALVGAANHEGQRARIGRGDAARHRRVDRDEPLRGRGLDIGARGRDIDRRTIEKQSARRGVGEDFAFVDRSDMLARGEHGDDGFGADDGLGRRCSAGAACFDRARQRFLAEVEGAHLMPRLREVRSHAAAHIAESDECDFHVSDLSTRLRASR